MIESKSILVLSLYDKKNKNSVLEIFWLQSKVSTKHTQTSNPELEYTLSNNENFDSARIATSQVPGKIVDLKYFEDLDYLCIGL